MEITNLLGQEGIVAMLIQGLKLFLLQ